MNLIKSAHAIVCNPVLEPLCEGGSSKINSNPQSYTSNVISTVLTSLLIFGVIFFLVHLILAGYKMISSSGDAKKYEEAQHALRDSLIGIVIVLSVFVIIKVLLTIFGIDAGTTGLSIPWPSL